MKEPKTRVFLTGATGVMGMAALKELEARKSDYEITVFARPSKINRKKLAPFQTQGVKVIWGDLLDKEKIMEGVRNADIVLHVGGMVSPVADHYPEQTLKVNVESMKLIADSVAEVEKEDPEREIKVVYVGSVSQYGSKLPPDHWGKAGDRLSAAKFDAYALSKILAERVLAESGIRKWVSLRQTAILHSGLLKKADDPISFHVPLRGAIEWVSVEDSGRVLERICRKEVPENFWCDYYNIGGGENFRLINYEFEKGLLKAIGCPAPEKIFEPSWFATDNFHGIWFEDSDELDDILKYRQKDTFSECLKRLKKELPFYFRFAPLAPSFLIKGFMKKVAQSKELGTLGWLNQGNEPRILACWGGREKQSMIPGWEKTKIEIPDKRSPGVKRNVRKEEKDATLKETICEKGHTYLTSRILERGGHGCPECLKESVFPPGNCLDKI